MILFLLFTASILTALQTGTGAVINAPRVAFIGREGLMGRPRGSANLPKVKYGSPETEVYGLGMEKQRRIIELISEGCDSPELAQKLGVTENTAKQYVHIVLLRTGHRSRLSLVISHLWGKIRALEIELRDLREGRHDHDV
ncbi:MAG TPA: hypothetical protein VF819_11870 [Nitrospira sp.]